jgi:hypothetical protein
MRQVFHWYLDETEQHIAHRVILTPPVAKRCHVRGYIVRVSSGVTGHSLISITLDQPHSTIRMQRHSGEKLLHGGRDFCACEEMPAHSCFHLRIQQTNNLERAKSKREQRKLIGNFTLGIEQSSLRETYRAGQTPHPPCSALRS